MAWIAPVAQAAGGAISKETQESNDSMGMESAGELRTSDILMGFAFGPAEANTFRKSRARRHTLRARAREAEFQADAAALEGRRVAANIMGELNNVLATRIAMAGATGTVGDIGTIKGAIGGDMSDSFLNIDMAKIGAQLKSNNLRAKAKMYRRQAKLTKITGPLEALGTGLTTFGSVFGSTGPQSQ